MNEILKKLSVGSLNGEVVSEILGNPTDFPTELIEKLSIETVLRYSNGNMDYVDGDWIMNNLKSFWATNEYFFQNFGFGEIAWECYDAFDAGEYVRSTDTPDTDPVEKYTKPLIEKILEKL